MGFQYILPYSLWIQLFIALICLCDSTNCEQTKQCGNRHITKEVETITGHFETKKHYIDPYDCPLEDGPEEDTLCCEPAEYQCCRARHFWEIKPLYAVIISVFVVILSATVTISLIACCCYERCPLYMYCRAEAKPDYIGRPEDAAFLQMPSENVKNIRVYNPSKASQEFV